MWPSPWSSWAAARPATPHHAAPPQPSQADRVKAVVRARTANLDAADNAAEARLFSLPVLINVGPGAVPGGAVLVWGAAAARQSA